MWPPALRDEILRAASGCLGLKNVTFRAENRSKSLSEMRFCGQAPQELPGASEGLIRDGNLERDKVLSNGIVFPEPGKADTSGGAEVERNALDRSPFARQQVHFFVLASQTTREDVKRLTPRPVQDSGDSIGL